jgi:hypothetical protein
MAGLDRASPSVLVEAVAQPDRDRVHRQQDDQQDHDGRRSQHPELLLESRDPVEDLDWQSGELAGEPVGVEGDEGQRASRSSCPAQ